MLDGAPEIKNREIVKKFEHLNKLLTIRLPTTPNYPRSSIIPRTCLIPRIRSTSQVYLKPLTHPILSFAPNIPGILKLPHSPNIRHPPEPPYASNTQKISDSFSFSNRTLIRPFTFKSKSFWKTIGRYNLCKSKLKSHGRRQHSTVTAAFV